MLSHLVDSLSLRHEQVYCPFDADPLTGNKADLVHTQASIFEALFEP